MGHSRRPPSHAHRDGGLGRTRRGGTTFGRRCGEPADGAAAFGAYQAALPHVITAGGAEVRAGARAAICCLRRRRACKNRQSSCRSGGDRGGVRPRQRGTRARAPSAGQRRAAGRTGNTRDGPHTTTRMWAAGGEPAWNAIQQKRQQPDRRRRCDEQRVSENPGRRDANTVRVAARMFPGRLPTRHATFCSRRKQWESRLPTSDNRHRTEARRGDQTSDARLPSAKGGG